MLERLKCNPLEILAMIANNDIEALGEQQEIPIALRLKAASDLVPYIAPKLRASQVEFTDSREDQRLIVDLSGSPELAEKLARSAGESFEFMCNEPETEDGSV
jgi:translation initiation factor 2 beta subunit (eIF-2beta)/eIF-5